MSASKRYMQPRCVDANRPGNLTFISTHRSKVSSPSLSISNFLFHFNSAATATRVMAADPAQDENLLQLAVIIPNPERRWVLVYDVVPLQSYDPTLEEEVQEEEEEKEMPKGGEEAEVHEATIEEPEVVDQPKSLVAAPEREESVADTEQSAASAAE